VRFRRELAAHLICRWLPRISGVHDLDPHGTLESGQERTPGRAPGPAIGEEHYELDAAAKQRESPARSRASRSGYWAGRLPPLSLPKRVPS
jgi:hypothetical protein